ncbi:hypothetical protein CTAYLR_006831, partial [Chrysophaeum taylorii]
MGPKLLIALGVVSAFAPGQRLLKTPRRTQSGTRMRIAMEDFGILRGTPFSFKDEWAGEECISEAKMETYMNKQGLRYKMNKTDKERAGMKLFNFPEVKFTVPVLNVDVSIAAPEVDSIWEALGFTSTSNNAARQEEKKKAIKKEAEAEEKYKDLLTFWKDKYGYSKYVPGTWFYADQLSTDDDELKKTSGFRAIMMILVVLGHALGLRSGVSCRAQPQDDIGKQAKGFYVRPSAAIERGGGFFVPGLEGPKVRIAGGTAILALLAANHVESARAAWDAPLVVSEALAAAAALAVVVPYLLPSRETPAAVVERRLVIAPDENADELRWALAALRQLTPTVAVALTRRHKVVLLETSPALCRIPGDDTLYSPAPKNSGLRLVDKTRETARLFSLFPDATRAALFVRSLHRPDLEWILALDDPSAFDPTDLPCYARIENHGPT